MSRPWQAYAHHTLDSSQTLRQIQQRGITREDFLNAMNARRIGTGVHYLAIPEHPYYQQRYGWKPEQWPNATAIGRQTVSLPLSPKLTGTDVDRVINAVRALVD